MSGTVPATAVPNIYDAVIDGFGYIFLNSLMQSQPFRVQRAAYSNTATFIQRTNVSGSYGDNEQDFFLTVSQNDWSEGQGQRFLRGNDPDRSRRYYVGVAGDGTIQGQVTIRRALKPITLAGNVKGACPVGAAQGPNGHAFCTTTNLYLVDANGSVSDQGAHGAGTTAAGGLCTDGRNIYVSGATKIRKFDGASFSDFSATVTGEIAFLNNALYGYKPSTGVLSTYDTSGAQTVLFTWKDATGAGRASAGRLCPFGNQLLVFFPFLTDRPELWIYDGTATSRVAELSSSVIGHDLEVIEGVVYLSGVISDSAAGFASGAVPVIWAYVSGTITEIWRSQVAAVGVAPQVDSVYQPALGAIGGRLVFTDTVNQSLNEYNPSTGAISVVGQHTREGSANVARTWITSAPNSVFLTYDEASGAPKAIFYPDPSFFATLATIDSSLIDFDNSLTKYFRGIKVDWSDGGSVDISYQVDSLTGAYTSLQTSAVSGTEYLLPAGTAGRSISVRVTLNNDLITQPTLKRVYVRASPRQQTYKIRNYVLDLTGRNDRGEQNNMVVRRDGTQHTLTGAQMAANLIAAITATAPISFTDRFGTFTGVFQQGQGVTELDEVRPGEFVAQVTVREV